MINRYFFQWDLLCISMYITSDAMSNLEKVTWSISPIHLNFVVFDYRKMDTCQCFLLACLSQYLNILIETQTAIRNSKIFFLFLRITKNMVKMLTLKGQTPIGLKLKGFFQYQKKNDVLVQIIIVTITHTKKKKVPKK